MLQHFPKHENSTKERGYSATPLEIRKTAGTDDAVRRKRLTGHFRGIFDTARPASPRFPTNAFGAEIMCFCEYRINILTAQT